MKTAMKLILTLGIICGAGIVVGDNPTSAKVTKMDKGPLLLDLSDKTAAKPQLRADSAAKYSGKALPNKASNYTPPVELLKHCYSDLWLMDCKRGFKVFETWGNCRKSACDQRCAQKKECKSYLYDDTGENADCALLKVTGESSKELGIAGVDLKPIEPSTTKTPSIKEDDDCSEFTFASCDEDEADAKGIYTGETRTVDLCKENCVRDIHNIQGKCKSFLYDSLEIGGDCWESPFTLASEIVSSTCKVFRGRACTDCEESVRKDESQKYKNCLWDHRNKTDCLAGNCDITWLGDAIESTKRPTDEENCQYMCYSYFNKSMPDYHCSHYEYNTVDDTCKLFSEDGKTKPDPPKCTSVVALKDVDQDVLDQCSVGKKTTTTEPSTTTEPAGTTTEPADGTTTAPADGTTTEPADGTTTEPADGTTTEPSTGTTTSDSTTTATTTPSTVTTTPHTGNFGNILIVEGWSNTVTLLDVENKKNCQLTEFPKKPGRPAGGLITSDGSPQPLICGGSYDGATQDQCYLLKSGKWSKILKLPERTRSFFGVSVDSQWIMFSGGYTDKPADSSAKKTSLLVNKKGQIINLKPLTKARWLHCSAILSSNESSTEVGVLGGFLGVGGTSRSMERYSCVKGDTPTCEKLSDGPDMVNGGNYVGCGSLQTGQGGRVLLAIGNRNGRPTEVLNLGNKESKWEILSADMDEPHKEENYGDPYSFVTSTTDPTVGYYLPFLRQYIYRVKCEDAQTCSFEKIDTGNYPNPRGLVAMAVPADALTCP